VYISFLLRVLRLDEALGMSREDAPPIAAEPKTQRERVAHGALTKDQADNGTNIPTYDDPPLDQLDETEDGSFSVEENPWRGEDPPEEVPHDEYSGNEYDEDVPDDEMVSRVGDENQETMSEDPLEESPSDDPTHASESFDALEHQGDTSTFGTGEGGDDEETQVTQGSQASRGTRGSLAVTLKERYRGKRSPGIRMPLSSPTVGKSETSIGTSSANSPVNGISVDTPRFSDEEDYGGVDSPGFSDNTSKAEFEGTDDGENGRCREGDTLPYSGEDADEFASPRSESQFSPQSDGFASRQSGSHFSPQSDFTDGDEFMSPLGSTTGQARDQALQQQGNDGTTPPPYESGESPQTSQPSPFVVMSPSDAGSYTDGSYTTDASSMISGDANPSTRRALILQMAKARMNSGKRREEVELEENGADADADADTDSENLSSKVKGENDEGSMTRTGQIASDDAVEMARARSPGGSFDDFEGVTGDLD